MNNISRTRPKVGLALSGGVARGPVHVGVLSVLEREGIPIDFVAGTSAGALVGAAYCAGLPLPRLKALAAETSWHDVASLTWPRWGFITFKKMESFITGLIGELDVRDLSIPFAAVATDIERGEPVALREGSLARAVRASCSVPGFVTPVPINGRLYCDGGVSDNLPAHIVRDMGADYVIGVDLFVHGKPRWGPLGMETLVRRAGGGYKGVDCLIVPALSGRTYFRLSRSEEYIVLGMVAAETMLPKLKRDLAMCLPPHCPPPSPSQVPETIWANS